MKIKLDYEKLVVLLHRKRLKLTTVVREVGLSTNIVTSINNNKSINIDSACKIASYLEVGLDDIVSFEKVD